VHKSQHNAELVYTINSSNTNEVNAIFCAVVQRQIVAVQCEKELGAEIVVKR
jgi:hypothetical protein